MTDTLTRGDTEIEVLEALDFDADVPCDYGQCEQKATHKITCGICYAAYEFVCAQHTEEMVIVKREVKDFVIKFDGSCQHVPYLVDCPLDPI